MQDHASVCEGARDVFLGKKIRLRPVPAIRVGTTVMSEPLSGQDGRGRRVSDTVCHGDYCGCGRGAWSGPDGEIWPVEVRTTEFTLWRL